MATDERSSTNSWPFLAARMHHEAALIRIWDVVARSSSDVAAHRVCGCTAWDLSKLADFTPAGECDVMIHHEHGRVYGTNQVAC